MSSSNSSQIQTIPIIPSLKVCYKWNALSPASAFISWSQQSSRSEIFTLCYNSTTHTGTKCMTRLILPSVINKKRKHHKKIHNKKAKTHSRKWLNSMQHITMRVWSLTWHTWYKYDIRLYLMIPQAWKSVFLRVFIVSVSAADKQNIRWIVYVSVFVWSYYRKKFLRLLLSVFMAVEMLMFCLCDKFGYC